MFKPFSSAFICLLSGIFVISCSEEQSSTPISSLHTVEVPAQQALAPNLYVDGSNNVYLSWVEVVNDSIDTLKISQMAGGGTVEDFEWASPKTVAMGTDWFVNWADFPTVASFVDNPEVLATHWLPKRAAGTYDYDIRVAISKNKGQDWPTQFLLHTDGVAAEHGFVSMVPTPTNRIFATWLDGRNTKSDTGDKDVEHDHGHGGGAMTLRAAEFDINGQLYAEAELDDRVCDCCQTDAVWTDNGPMVVYRDRSAEEIRDISLIRQVDGQWQAPQVMGKDNWEIAGCPVNGPAIAARAQQVAVAWFTGALDGGAVQVVLSDDGGTTFGEPIRIDDGQAVGRVDVVIKTDGEVVVSWLEQMEDHGLIRIAEISNTDKVITKYTIVETGTSRQHGFPIMEMWGDELFFAWTNVDSLITIKTGLWTTE